MSQRRWAALCAVSGFVAAGLFATTAVAFYLKVPSAQAQAQASVALAAPAPVAVAQAAAPTAEPEAPRLSDEASYFARVRNRLHWVRMQVGSQVLLAPDLESRMLLAKAAAKHAGLADVGLDWRDVYGLINAETSWVPRRGSSRDGTPNLGIAQFEPKTAQALGITDPDDVVEAIHAAAMHMKEAAQWSSERIRGLKLAKSERAQKLREGVSVYYNLGWKARNEWNGRNTDELPVPTQRHIANARLGAQEAVILDGQLRAQAFGRRGAIVTASGEDSRI